MNKALKDLIQNSGYKQRFIAQKLGMHPTYLSQLIHGHRRPRDLDKQALAGFFRVPVGSLFLTLL
ncbi:MAG: helix-turn-helix transcriptional regulator [Thermodesulfobacteriota bacterium]